MWIQIIRICIRNNANPDLSGSFWLFLFRIQILEFELAPLISICSWFASWPFWWWACTVNLYRWFFQSGWTRWPRIMGWKQLVRHGIGRTSTAGSVALFGSMGVNLYLLSFNSDMLLCPLCSLDALRLVLHTGDFTGLSNFNRLPRWFSMVGHPPLVLGLSEEGRLHNGHLILDLLLKGKRSSTFFSGSKSRSSWNPSMGLGGVARVLGALLLDLDIFWLLSG